ncbi:MAG: replication initiator protein [Microvirus sp.]|nr:MAG: replication initiator protein [Microvirus sp.]
MRCINPLTLKSGLTVPCGHCNFCLSNRRADWSFRLYQENKVSQSSHFLTLTYDDSTVPVGDDCLSLCKRDYQLFTKKLRKESETPLRYYAVGEYGTQTARPHYHAIMFNMLPDLCDQLPKIWGKGQVHVGQVNPASIHYVTKYVINRDIDVRGREPPFTVMSLRPGIGSIYLNTHKNYHQDALRYYSHQKGIYQRLPRYFKDKFFTKEQRELMAENAEYESSKVYAKNLEYLSQFHPDPVRYYADMRLQAHDTLVKSINKNDQF